MLEALGAPENPMINVDDVAALILARTQAVATFTSAVPGKAWLDQGPDTPDGYPYWVFKLKAGQAEVFSGTAYKQAWVVEGMAYCPVGATGVNLQNVQQALAACFVTDAGKAAMKAAALRSATEKVLHTRPLQPAGQFDKTLREGRDVALVGYAFEVLVQGDKGAN